MKKYQQLAEQLREQIASGIWQPGDRLPSLRDQVALSGMSFMTVSHAYQLLESQGYIIARPQSGYYVAPQAIFILDGKNRCLRKRGITTMVFCIALRFRNVWCLVFVLVGSPPENMHVKFNACS